MKDHGISTFEMMKTLSDDAKIILGGCFGVLGIPGKSTLTFLMKEARPTTRAKVALDECVLAGALSQRSLTGGGVEYLVQVNCSDFGKWIRRNRSKGKWPLTESVLPTDGEPLVSFRRIYEKMQRGKVSADERTKS